MIMRNLLQSLAADRRGSFAIETAFVAPVLILMTLGIYEVGTIVARQHELQSVANESEIIILATNQGAETNVETIKSIVQESVGLAADEVSLTQSYRCGTDIALVASAILCSAENKTISSYIDISITEQYTPKWTYMGVGAPITFSINRRVQVS